MAQKISTLSPIGKFNNIVIVVENYYETETWLLAVVASLTVLTAVLCGLWCLLAAKNVKEDGKIVFDDDDDVREKSRGSRSTAGSDFSVIEMGKEKVEETGGIKNYMTGVGKSLIFMKK